MDALREIRQSLRDLDVTAKPLRHFGILFCVVFFVLVAIIVYKHWGQWALIVRHPWAWGLAAAGLISLGLGYLWPRVLVRPYRLWMGFALVLGVIMSTLILSVVYYVLLTPVGVVMRLLGKDPLIRKIDRQAKSYWTQRPPDTNDPKRIEKMF